MEQDRREFAEFYAAARDDCLRVVLITVGDRQLAEDLVAEAFVKAWMSWRKVCALAAPRAWIVRSALNAHVSWWRRHRREVALGSHDTPAPASGDPARPARPVHVHLAAWSVDSNRDGTVTLTVRDLTHVALLARVLGEAGVPAVIALNAQCLSTQNQAPAPGGSVPGTVTRSSVSGGAWSAAANPCTASPPTTTRGSTTPASYLCRPGADGALPGTVRP